MLAVAQSAWTITDGVVRVYSGNGRRRKLWTVEARWQAEQEAARWRRLGYAFMRAAPVLVGRGRADV